eukprot:COSAG01_NODE_13610_length_1559_cov_1.521233_2_plen_107_part_00
MAVEMEIQDSRVVTLVIRDALRPDSQHVSGSRRRQIGISLHRHFLTITSPLLKRSDTLSDSKMKVHFVCARSFLLLPLNPGIISARLTSGPDRPTLNLPMRRVTLV